MTSPPVIPFPADRLEQAEAEAEAARKYRRSVSSLLAAAITGFLVAVPWQPMSANDATLPAPEITAARLAGFLFAGAIALGLVAAVNMLADEYGLSEKSWQVSAAPFVVPLVALAAWVVYFNPHHQDQKFALETDSVYFHRAPERRSFVTERHGSEYIVCGRPGRNPNTPYLCSQVNVSRPRASAVSGSFRSIEFDAGENGYIDYGATDCSGRSQMCSK